MNYIECFNRSRAASCSPFFCFRSWCLDGARCGVFSVAPLRRSWCASMLPGVECCPFAPLRRSWCASMLPGVECCPLHRCAVPGAPQCCQVWSVVRCTIFAVPGASMLPGVECCPLHRCAFPGAPQCCQAWSVARCTVAPFLVPRCCQVWSVARCTVAPFLVRLNAARCGVLPVHLLRPFWCALCAHFVTLYIL